MSTITVSIEFCAPTGLEQGKAVTQVELPSGTTIRGLIACLVQKYGEAAREKMLQPDGITPYVDFIVNGKVVSLDYMLKSGDELLILPPVFFGG